MHWHCLLQPTEAKAHKDAKNVQWPYEDYSTKTLPSEFGKVRSLQSCPVPPRLALAFLPYQCVYELALVLTWSCSCTGVAGEVGTHQRTGGRTDNNQIRDFGGCTFCCR
jgi:hypothetical protein